MKYYNSRNIFKCLIFAFLLTSIGCGKKQEISNAARQVIMQKMHKYLDSIGQTVPKSIKRINGTTVVKYKNGDTKILSKKKLDEFNISATAVEKSKNDQVQHPFRDKNISYKKTSDLSGVFVTIDPAPVLVHCTAEYSTTPGFIIGVFYMDSLIFPANTTEIDPISGFTIVINRTFFDKYGFWNPNPPASLILLTWSGFIHYRQTVFYTSDPTITTTTTTQVEFLQESALTPAGLI